jgi:hypothetical protein
MATAVTVTAAWLATEAQRMRGQLEAHWLAAELCCEVTPHPKLSGIVEARRSAEGVWLLAGTSAKVRAAARAAQMREWLACLGTLGARGRWL